MDIIFFDQKGEKNISDFQVDRNIRTIVVFGGEGRFNANEVYYLNKKQSLILTVNRRCSETAIILVVAYLTIKTLKNNLL